MRRVRHAVIALGIPLGGLMSSGFAPLAAPQTSVQTQQAAVQPSNAGPDATTATFGDWTLRCRVTSTPASARSCEIMQSIVLQGQTAPFAQLAFGRTTAGGPLFFTAVVPTNVSFPSAVKMFADDKDDQPTVVTWTRCLPTGCFASFAVTDAVLKRWRSQEASGRMTFVSGTGQETTVPFSFRGLARALDALGKD